MEGLDQLPPQYQPIAGLIFAAIVTIGSAVMFLRGRKEGAPQPKVQEFYASGQLADMGPVRELIEQIGLLTQQQVRTNIHLEKTANALTKVAELYEEQRDEAEFNAEVERRLEVERRSPRRKPPAE